MTRLTILVILLFFVSVVTAAPDNDNFADALAIPTTFDGIIPEMETATIETGEPVHSCRRFGAQTGTHSVWFVLTLDQPGIVSVSTELSDFVPEDDSLLSVYTGTSLETLTEVACNDDISDINRFSLINVSLPPGTYYIKASNWAMLEPLQPPSFLRLIVSVAPNILTPTPTPVTPTLTPMLTATPDWTATETPVNAITPTATMTETPISLVMNGGFEIDDNGDNIPDSWQGKNLTRDKRICNKPTKIRAYEGECAFQFKGVLGENSRLDQDLPGSNVLSGDVLVLSAAVDSRATVSGILTLKLKYTEFDAGIKGNGKDKVKISITDDTAEYQLFTATLTVDGTVTQVTLQAKYKLESGKVRIDAVRVERFRNLH